MRGGRRGFDRKFGEAFLEGLPSGPGVYEVLDSGGEVVYVGKARNLRRRLRQYRNAGRLKKHHKMRAIVAAAETIRLTSCPSELEAVLLENRLIQARQPRLNIAGAYSFLYPCIGVIRKGLELHLCYSTSPLEFPAFTFYGAYRSRLVTREGFLALLDVLEFIGHREPRSRAAAEHPRVRFSVVAVFRQVGDEWLGSLEAFLRGESRAFLEAAVLALVEKPFARRHPDRIQELLDALSRFHDDEARPLRAACVELGLKARLVPQAERDRLFLLARESRRLRRLSRGADRPS